MCNLRYYTARSTGSIGFTSTKSSLRHLFRSSSPKRNMMSSHMSTTPPLLSKTPKNNRWHWPFTWRHPSWERSWRSKQLEVEFDPACLTSPVTTPHPTDRKCRWDGLRQGYCLLGLQWSFGDIVYKIAMWHRLLCLLPPESHSSMQCNV